MEMNDFQQKIKEYSVGDDFEPLKVVFKIKPPIYINSPWIHFDGIINYLCFRECLGEDFYVLPSEVTVDTTDLMLPLKQSTADGFTVYHSSVALYHHSNLMRDTIYKRFTDKETYLLTDKQQQGRIHTNRGFFKDFMINYPILLTDSLTFYCNGDKKELERLLSNISYIGKKTSIGSGKILNYRIESIEEDYSFFKDNHVMRPVPTKFNIPLVEGMIIQMQSYKPPYWDKDNMAMCYVPPNQIKVGE